MLIGKIYSVITSNLLWLLLYFGYVLLYLLHLNRAEDMAYFSQSSFVALLPLALIGFSIASEYIYPFKKDWLKIDMNSLNNILYAFINDYGDALGKSLALLFVLKMERWVPVDTIAGFWPLYLPLVFQAVIGLLLYDFVYYWYHRISHHTTPLWRLHRLHHSTERLTTIAGFKFNILDIIIELFLLTAVMKVAGVPDKVYLVMVGFMTPATILSHANFAANIPDWAGWLIINPDNHRVHHANESLYYNKNFGGFTLFWDIIFGTYQPAKKIEIAEVGVKGHTTSRWIWGQLFDFLKP